REAIVPLASTGASCTAGEYNRPRPLRPPRAVSFFTRRAVLGGHTCAPAAPFSLRTLLSKVRGSCGSAVPKTTWTPAKVVHWVVISWIVPPAQDALGPSVTPRGVGGVA